MGTDDDPIALVVVAVDQVVPEHFIVVAPDQLESDPGQIGNRSPEFVPGKVRNPQRRCIVLSVTFCCGTAPRNVALGAAQ